MLQLFSDVCARFCVPCRLCGSKPPRAQVLRLHEPAGRRQMILLSCVFMMTAVASGKTTDEKAGGQADLARRFPREGGAYGLGHIWFDREPEPVAPEDQGGEDRSVGDAPGPGSVVDDEEDSSRFHLSSSLSQLFIYENHPLRYSNDEPDWHWDGGLSLDLEWQLLDNLSLTPSGGTRWLRYAWHPDSDSDEPFASLQITWNPGGCWLVSARHESFWDLEPGFGPTVYAGHMSSLRLQYDTTVAARPGPFRWQWYAEATRNLAEPSLHDYFGFALGGGTAIRLVPQHLSLQIGAGVSFQKYPRYELAVGRIRQGWNTHASAALVWTPGERIQVSLGLEWMHSAENAGLFRFDYIGVPLAVQISF